MVASGNLRITTVARGKSVLWRGVAATETPFERMRGIMFARPGAFPPTLIDFPESGRRRNAIHSFFCPVFDAIFLDAGGRVVDVVPEIRPNNPFIVPRAVAASVLELPAGEAAKKKIRIGEVLVG